MTGTGDSGESGSRLTLRHWKRAVLDGGAVLVGILLAFGIDAAWEQRGDRIRAEAYQTALVREVELTRELLESQGGVIESRREHLDRVFTEIVYASGDLDRGTLLDVLLGDGLGPYTVREPSRGALTDLLASHGLGVLDDHEVRQLLAVYAQELETNVDRQQAVQNDWTSSITAYLGVNLSLPDLLEADFDVPGLRAGTFPVRHQAFVGNRDFANLLTLQAFLLLRLDESRRSLMETADEVLRALEAL